MFCSALPALDLAYSCCLKRGQADNCNRVKRSSFSALVLSRENSLSERQAFEGVGRWHDGAGRTAEVEVAGADEVVGLGDEGGADEAVVAAPVTEILRNS